jgi:ribulose-phosphate 3-epimerase
VEALSPALSRPVEIAPSILSADFAALGAELESVLSGGADLLHLDVMDGHFVPNITFGPPLVRSIRKATDALRSPPRGRTTLDCHLMISEPTKYVGAFCDAGADWVSVHVEVDGKTDDVGKALRIVREKGRRPGIVLNPDTPVARLDPFLPLVDYVLVMSVFPGFGGQKFIASSLDAVRALVARGFPGAIEIDGGINETTAALAIEAGARVLVAGNSVFGAADRADAIRRLRGAAA